jgi:hypothetical protein
MLQWQCQVRYQMYQRPADIQRQYYNISNDFFQSLPKMIIFESSNYCLHSVGLVLIFFKLKKIDLQIFAIFLFSINLFLDKCF